MALSIVAGLHGFIVPTNFFITPTNLRPNHAAMRASSSRMLALDDTGVVLAQNLGSMVGAGGMLALGVLAAANDFANSGMVAEDRSSFMRTGIDDEEACIIYQDKQICGPAWYEEDGNVCVLHQEGWKCA